MEKKLTKEENLNPAIEEKEIEKTEQEVLPDSVNGNDDDGEWGKPPIKPGEGGENPNPVTPGAGTKD